MFHNSRAQRLKRRRMIIAGLSVATVLFLFVGFLLWNQREIPTITIQIENEAIYSDEALPAFQVDISADQKTKEIILDRGTGYTVQDFMNELQKEESYRFECEFVPDSQEESELKKEYPIRLVFLEKIKGQLESNWRHIFQVDVKEGTLTIKNSLGEWEENKFKFRDGSYAADEFLRLDDETYYFNQEGLKVTGQQEIWGKMYYFDQEGRFDDKKNAINPTLPMIALTFDDGPGKYTEKLLDKLEELEAKATFFMLGTNVAKYPNAVERMKEIGCEIGNHTTNHKKLTELSAAEITSQVEMTNTAIQNVIGESATVVRPPYGAVNDLVKTTINYPLIFWNVDTLDWETQNTEKIIKYTMEHVQDGDIVLMHDIYDTTIDAAIDLVEKLHGEGYQLVTVSEMAQARGVVLKTGEKYIRFRPVRK